MYFSDYRATMEKLDKIDILRNIQFDLTFKDKIKNLI